MSWLQDAAALAALAIFVGTVLLWVAALGGAQ